MATSIFVQYVILYQYLIGLYVTATDTLLKGEKIKDNLILSDYIYWAIKYYQMSSAHAITSVTTQDPKYKYLL